MISQEFKINISSHLKTIKMIKNPKKVEIFQIISKLQTNSLLLKILRKVSKDFMIQLIMKSNLLFQILNIFPKEINKVKMIMSLKIA
jgi:hypothetical protein